MPDQKKGVKWFFKEGLEGVAYFAEGEVIRKIMEQLGRVARTVNPELATKLTPQVEDEFANIVARIPRVLHKRKNTSDILDRLEKNRKDFGKEWDDTVKPIADAANQLYEETARLIGMLLKKNVSKEELFKIAAQLESKCKTFGNKLDRFFETISKAEEKMASDVQVLLDNEAFTEEDQRELLKIMTHFAKVRKEFGEKMWHDLVHTIINAAKKATHPDDPASVRDAKDDAAKLLISLMSAQTSEEKRLAAAGVGLTKFSREEYERPKSEKKSLLEISREMAKQAKESKARRKESWLQKIGK